MMTQLPKVAALLFIYVTVIVHTHAQSSGPEFLDCSTGSISLCVSDEGVRLPQNNKIFLGEGQPGATSGSVHISQKTKVRSTCGKLLWYEVQLFLYDTSTAYILNSGTYVSTDSLYEAEISFDTELSSDDFISNNGIPYTSGCFRYHRIKWIVMDSCGQIEICENRVEVYDCHAPSHPIPIFPYIVRSKITGPVYINRDTFQFEFADDSSPSTEILMSFSADRYLPDTVFYICSITAFGVEYPWILWIADAGVDLNCDGIIEWDERNIYQDTVSLVFINNCDGCECGYPADMHLEGRITTRDLLSIEKVEVTLSASGQPSQTYTTLQDGKYRFDNLTFPNEYTIKPERNDNHKNGVTTSDLVSLQKHLLGIELFDTPEQLIAADANHSWNVSAIDLIEIRKLILGIYTEFPNNPSWRFVPEEIVTNSPGSDFNFIGIKIGDVNNTAQPNFNSIVRRSALKSISWNVEGMAYKTNDHINIHFYLSDEVDLEGFQFTLSDPNLEFEAASSSTIDLDEAHYALFNDKMTFSWFDETGSKIKDGDILMRVKAKAKSDGYLSKSLIINSEITEAEMYSTDGEIYSPKLVIAEKNESFYLSVEPNPWKESTMLHFSSLHDGEIEIEIFDLNGQSIFSQNVMCTKGQNAIPLRSVYFNTTGLLFYSITSGSFNQSGKMFLLE